MIKISKKFEIGIILSLFLFYILSNISIPCIFHEITNLYCPGCGITRMFKAILQLDFYQALRFNPLVFIYLIGYIIYLFIEVILKKKIKLNNKFIIILLIITIIYGVIRNIPIFSYLQPTIIH